jgi:hypothetical protein
MSDPEGFDDLVPPPTAPTSPIPGQGWPAAPPPPPQYGPPMGYPGPYPTPYPQGYGGYPPPRGGNSGMAIAAMVCGICGFLCLIPGVVGIILGFVALPQIKRTGQGGRGMAITGIVVGSFWIVAFVLLIILGHTTNGQVQVGNSGDGSGLVGT